MSSTKQVSKTSLWQDESSAPSSYYFWFRWRHQSHEGGSRNGGKQAARFSRRPDRSDRLCAACVYGDLRDPAYFHSWRNPAHGIPGGAVVTNLRAGSPLFSETLFPIYFGSLCGAGFICATFGCARSFLCALQTIARKHFRKRQAFGDVVVNK